MGEGADGRASATEFKEGLPQKVPVELKANG